MLSILVICFGLSLGLQVQLNAPNETLVGYWPGDLTETPQERCSVAITSTKVFRIVGFRKVSEQTLPRNTTAAGIVYYSPTRSLWLGVADSTGTITWMYGPLNCQYPFQTQWDYPVMSFPGTVWDSAFTRLSKQSDTVISTFIGNDLVVEFGFNAGTGQPRIAKQLDVPWNFDKTQRTVVGFGDGKPFPGSSTPSVAIARQDQRNASFGTGELVLLDPNQSNPRPPSISYFPNLRGWQSQNVRTGVTALAFIDPYVSSSTGYILGFSPYSNQPQTIAFPFKPNQKWSTGVGWVTLPTDETGIGIFLLGSGYPGGVLSVRFVSEKSGQFELLSQEITLDYSGSTWISDSPSWISAPTAHGNDNYLYASAQRASGPVIFQTAFPFNIDTTKIVPKNKQTIIGREKRAVLCNSSSLCETLSPSKLCGPDCCQTYLPPKKSQFVSACCQDCNLGNCVGNPGQCVI